MKRVDAFILPFVFLLWAGCGGSPSEPGTPTVDPGRDTAVTPLPIQGITLSPASETLAAGERKQFIAEVRDESGQTMTGVALKWSIDDSTVARVDENGWVTALQKGTANLTTAYQEMKSKPAVIRVVSAKPVSIELTPADSKIEVGETRPFIATAKDAAGAAIDDITFSWTIADPEIAEVTSRGDVKGLQTGRTTLTAKSSGVESPPASIEVVPQAPVKRPVATIDIDPDASARTIAVGSNKKFTATAKDSSGAVIPNITFSWSLSNEGVISIESRDEEASKIVTALKAGSATLTASAEGKNGAAQITVVEPPQITGLYPQNNVQVTPKTEPSATFNTAMDFPSIQAGFTLNTGEGLSVAGAVQCNSPCTVATFVPAGDLPDGVYTAMVSSSVKSSGDLPLPNPVSWSFKVQAGTPTSCQPGPKPTNGWEVTRGQEPIQDMWGVHFVDLCEGWAVGMEMTLAHTTDGGVTWKRQNNIVWKNNQAPIIPPDLYDVFFIDSKTGWAAGWPDLVLATTDGGATWQEQKRNTFYTQQQNVWCLEFDPENPEKCTKTTTWCGEWDAAHTTCNKKNGVYLRRIRFADLSSGWVVGRFGSIYRTSNGGATWSNNVKIPNPVDCAANPVRAVGQDYTPHWFGLDVLSPSEIWMTGGGDDGGWCTGWNRVIVHTLDGGSTWTVQNDHPGFGGLEGGGRYHDIHLIGNFGWAVGEVGTILRTTDHGATWKRVTGTGAGGALLFGLSFTDPAHVWITGSNGVIVHSSNADAGTVPEVHWTKQNSGTGTQLRRSSFVDSNFGWIAGQFRLFRTTTGGNPSP